MIISLSVGKCTKSAGDQILFSLTVYIDKLCIFSLVNEKTTKVIQAAFQHAKYPSISNEKSILFVGKVKYGLAK